MEPISSGYAAKAGAAVVSDVAKKWLVPSVERLLSNRKLNKDLLEHAVLNKYTEYLIRSHERYSAMSTIVFQNQPKQLGDLYIPLTLQAPQGEGDDSIKVGSTYPETFIARHKKLLVIDDAGMGKSTLLKRLFLSSIDANVGVPMFLSLRSIGGTEPVEQVLLKELSPINGLVESRELFHVLLNRGEFTFFLDGYDEIPFQRRSVVASLLQEFIARASNNDFVMSSRPDPALASFAGFKKLRIKPLSEQEAFALIRRYDKGGSIAEPLIAKLAKDKSAAEFMTNPLLVSLLYKSYEYKPTLPTKKHVFYRQVYDSLFETHDLTKEGAYVRDKLCGFDIEDFHRFLRALGFLTAKEGQIEYDRDTFVKRISEALQLCEGLKARTATVLQDLVSTVPLMQKDGDNIRWNHKSLQDYFAAQFIATDSGDLRGAILSRLSQHAGRYENILNIYYDIDPNGFREHVSVPFAKRVLEYAASSYKWAEKLPLDHVRRRQEVHYSRKTIIGMTDHPRDATQLQAALKKFGDKSRLGAEEILMVMEHMLVSMPWHESTLIKILLEKGNPLISPPEKGPAKNLPVQNVVLTESRTNPLNKAGNFTQTTDALRATIESVSIEHAESLLAADHHRTADKNELLRGL